MTRSGVDRQAIAKMARDIQREFDKHPIRVPVEADGSASPAGTNLGSTIYNGPVILGDANGAQLAWGNRTVHQTQRRDQPIAPGFEPIAQAVVSTLERLAAVGLPAQDQRDAEDAARDVLTEVTQVEPDRGKVRRALSVLKGLLAPVAMGLVAGTAEGAQGWAKAAIEQLGSHY
jgi:hypothetical protein